MQLILHIQPVVFPVLRDEQKLSRTSIKRFIRFVKQQDIKMYVCIYMHLTLVKVKLGTQKILKVIMGDKVTCVFFFFFSLLF